MTIGDLIESCILTLQIFKCKLIINHKIYQNILKFQLWCLASNSRIHEHLVACNYQGILKDNNLLYVSNDVIYTKRQSNLIYYMVSIDIIIVYI